MSTLSRILKLGSEEVGGDTIERLQQQLDFDPSSLQFAHLAELLRRSGRLQEAIEVCRMGLNHHPEYVGGLVAFGCACLEAGRGGEAREALEKATELSPQNLVAHVKLGHLHELEGRRGEALRHFETALSFGADDEDLKVRVQRLSLALQGQEHPQVVSSSVGSAVIMSRTKAILQAKIAALETYRRRFQQ